ncbi:hypothetical protein FO519_000396 [Halicephalobus sp. NKZ332]|nr:hypothetical protein FO519_000396 [Halicephalobus sp. NKZ332]
MTATESVAAFNSLVPEQSRTTSTASSVVDDEAGGSESNFSLKDDEDVEPQTPVTQLFSAVSLIQKQVTYLTHQISSIKSALNVPGCQCNPCSKMTDKLDSHLSDDSLTPKMSDDKKENGLTIPVLDQENPRSDAEPSPNLLESLLASASQNYENFDFSGKRGRKSKYCNAEMKLQVASYAKRFGPTAAARKFNIPPSVASYYYRKALGKMNPDSSVRSPSALEKESFNGMDDSSGFPSHLSGSPGFLRGRGRGRPKLIGDELDAALVDFMVEVKRNDPRRHLSTSRTLEIAKEYIKKHQPGLLEDDGGIVNLKHTWAMKLLARVSEREQELHGTSEQPNVTHDMALFNMMDKSADFASMVSNLVSQLNQNPDMVKLEELLGNNENKDNVENELSSQADEEATSDALKTFLASLANAQAGSA